MSILITLFITSMLSFVCIAIIDILNQKSLTGKNFYNNEVYRLYLTIKSRMHRIPERFLKEIFFVDDYLSEKKERVERLKHKYARDKRKNTKKKLNRAKKVRNEIQKNIYELTERCEKYRRITSTELSCIFQSTEI